MHSAEHTEGGQLINPYQMCTWEERWKGQPRPTPPEVSTSLALSKYLAKEVTVAHDPPAHACRGTRLPPEGSQPVTKHSNSATAGPMTSTWYAHVVAYPHLSWNCAGTRDFLFSTSIPEVRPARGLILQPLSSFHTHHSLQVFFPTHPALVPTS